MSDTEPQSMDEGPLATGLKHSAGAAFGMAFVGLGAASVGGWPESNALAVAAFGVAVSAAFALQWVLWVLGVGKYGTTDR